MSRSHWEEQAAFLTPDIGSSYDLRNTRYKNVLFIDDAEATHEDHKTIRYNCNPRQATARASKAPLTCRSGKLQTISEWVFGLSGTAH